MARKANNSTLAAYLDAFMAEKPVLNRGLRAGSLAPLPGQPGLFQVGLEALYGDELSVYAPQQLHAPETFLSGLEASPVIALDTGSELTIKALQIFLNLAGYRDSTGKPLSEDGTWGKSSAFALAAWQNANAGKEGISNINIDQRRSRVWMASPLVSDIRAKLLTTQRGRTELARSPVELRQAQPSDARNAIPSGAGETSAGPGNAFETSQNVRAILSALGVRNVSGTVPVDRALVAAWQGRAKAYGLNPAISAQEGAWQVAVNAATLSTLRTKSRMSSKGQRVQRPVTRTASGATAATTSAGKSAATAGTLPVQTADVQRVLRALGWSKTVAADGKYGAHTRAAWESSATRRGLDKTITGQAGAPLVNVNSTTLARLQQDAAVGDSKGSSTEITPVHKQLVATPVAAAAPAGAGMLQVPTRNVQALLIKLRWASKGLTDGKFGPRTQMAWEKSATHRGLDPQITRGSSAVSVAVNAATLARLERDAKLGYVNPPYGPAGTPVVSPAPVILKKKPAGKSEEAPPKSGLSKVQVGTLQDILLKLKFSVGKAGRDGLWGASTQKAWELAAKNRQLENTISRASPTEAWVSPATLEQLSLAATGAAIKPNDATPQPSAGDTSIVAVDTKVLGNILRAFQKTVKKSAELVPAWKSIANSEKLDARALIQRGALFAVKNTVFMLEQEAAIRISAAELVQASTTNVAVSTLQDAISFWSNYDAAKKTFGATYTPKSRGTWDTDTLTWALRYLNIAPGLATTVWERALPQLVSKDKHSLKLPPKFVPQINTDAANFKKLGGVIAKKTVEAKKQAAAEAKYQSLLDARVAASTVILSVKALQQALSEIYAKYKAGQIKLPKGAPAPVNVPRSGTWDAATRSGMLLAYGQDLLANLPVGLANDLFARLLFKPSGGVAGLYGLYGLGAVLPGSGATYIKVPPAVAKYVADDAAEWVLTTHETPGAGVTVLPSGQGVITQLDPALVTGRVPSSVTNNITNTTNTTTTSSQVPSAEVSPSAGPAPVALTSDTTAPAPDAAAAPDATPAPAAATPAAEGGSGWLWLMGGAAALAVGASMSDKKKAQTLKPASRTPVRARKKLAR